MDFIKSVFERVMNYKFKLTDVNPKAIGDCISWGFGINKRPYSSRDMVEIGALSVLSCAIITAIALAENLADCLISPWGFSAISVVGMLVGNAIITIALEVAIIAFIEHVNGPRWLVTSVFILALVVNMIASVISTITGVFAAAGLSAFIDGYNSALGIVLTVVFCVVDVVVALMIANNLSDYIKSGVGESTLDNVEKIEAVENKVSATEDKTVATENEEKAEGNAEESKEVAEENNKENEENKEDDENDIIDL